MPLFSEEWMEGFGRAPKGCTGKAIFPYLWRVSGYGSNTLHFLLAWASSVVEDHGDLALIVPAARLFPRTKCDGASQGAETRSGWYCMYADVPHLCTFSATERWIAYNKRQGLASSEQSAALSRGRLTHKLVENQTALVEEALSNGSVDMLKALATLYSFLQSFRQPWFKADIQAVLDEPPLAALRRQPYVSMHIRRADKIREAKPTKTTVYFDKVVKFLTATSLHDGGLAAGDVEGLWLSSDDAAVYDEVKQLAPEYFPNIKPEAVLYVTSRVNTTTAASKAEAAVERNSYEAMTLLHAELHMLAGAHVFCGTYTSNVGSIVALMRESLSLPRDSALSADSMESRTLFAGWVPGQRRPPASRGQLEEATSNVQNAKLEISHMSFASALIVLSSFLCLSILLIRVARLCFHGALHGCHRLCSV
ncbi:unnamed protein product [Scytosiphon promiscuus]